MSSADRRPSVLLLSVTRLEQDLLGGIPPNDKCLMEAGGNTSKVVDRDVTKTETAIKATMVVLATAYVISGLFCSHVTESLVLLASVYQVLHGIVPIVGDIISSKIHSKTNTYGWTRINVLSLLISNLLLSAFCFSVFVEAVQELCHGHKELHIHQPIIVVIVGTSGLLLNVLAFVSIGGFTGYQKSMLRSGCNADDGNTVRLSIDANGNDDEINTNVKPGNAASALWNFVRDVFGLIVTFTIGATTFYLPKSIPSYLDPALCAVFIILLMASTYNILVESASILMLSIPNHIQVESLEKDLVSEFPGVVDVHDLHIWNLTNTDHVTTVHVVFESFDYYHGSVLKLTKFLTDKGITKSTIQPEFIVDNSLPSDDCNLPCPGMENCLPRTCCGSRPSRLRRRKDERLDVNRHSNGTTLTSVQNPETSDV